MHGNLQSGLWGRGGGGDSVKHAAPGEEVVGLMPLYVHPLPTGWVGVSIM